VGIGLPRGNPKAAPGVEGHLHGVDQLGKLFFRREKIDLHSLMNGHLLDLVLTAQKDVLSSGKWSRQIRDHGDEGGEVRVVGLDLAALRGGPDGFVAV
jgi:hypothetical protein